MEDIPFCTNFALTFSNLLGAVLILFMSSSIVIREDKKFHFLEPNITDSIYENEFNSEYINSYIDNNINSNNLDEKNLGKESSNTERKIPKEDLKLIYDIIWIDLSSFAIIGFSLISFCLPQDEIDCQINCHSCLECSFFDLCKDRSEMCGLYLFYPCISIYDLVLLFIYGFYFAFDAIGKQMLRYFSIFTLMIMHGFIAGLITVDMKINDVFAKDIIILTTSCILIFANFLGLLIPNIKYLNVCNCNCSFFYKIPCIYKCCEYFNFCESCHCCCSPSNIIDNSEENKLLKI